jgi:hypothetical protein
MRALVYGGPGSRSWHEVPDPAIKDPEDAIVRVDAGTGLVDTSTTPLLLRLVRALGRPPLPRTAVGPFGPGGEASFLCQEADRDDSL